MTNLQTDDIVGYELEIEFYKNCKPNVDKHWIGSKATCIRKAKLMTNFHRIVSMEPVTGWQWLRTYGDPHRRM